MDFELKINPPFSLESVVKSHGWVQLRPYNWDPEAGILSYSDLLASGNCVRYSISSTEDGVLITVIGDVENHARKEIEPRIEWMLAAEQDLSEFYHAAAKEPKLIQVVANGQGRILRSATVFEDLLKTMLTTNTAWSGTKRMVNTLLDLYGKPMQDDMDDRSFPTPEILANRSEEELREHARLGYRSPYVLELARSVADGKLDLEAYKRTTMTTEDLRKELLAIKGIGQYAAANLLMLLGRYDYIPIDSWAYKTVSQEWFDGEPVNKEQVEAVFQKWGVWKGLVYWFWEYSGGD